MEIHEQENRNVSAAAVLAATTIIPMAEAGPGRGRNFNNHGNHHAYNGGHRGRGHYRNGKWIALGILGAAAASRREFRQR